MCFNLINEPAGVDAKTHARVIELLVKAIRRESPQRLIIADGRDYASTVCAELKRLNIAQATRGYRPMPLTHYRASWVANSDSFSIPEWPILATWQGYLYSKAKPEFSSPLIIETHLKKPAKLKIKVATVSGPNKLCCRVDGKIIWQQTFNPGPGQGPWQTVVHQPQWGIYQNIYNKDYFIDIPANTKTIELLLESGDWMNFNGLSIMYSDKEVSQEHKLKIQPQWGFKCPIIKYDPANNISHFAGPAPVDGQSLWDDHLKAWYDLSREKTGVIVGEWGCHNKTPHDVTLRWMEDNLKNYAKAKIGWALWNFKGSFGIIDSERKDVQYEDFHGHQLDRKMLELLQKY
ncbi:MAG: hypothetical protein JEZ07_14865 [Phycisphaerae bacterium]|nr:hypothetical protein [Phycisphaerae bacterium]